MSDGSSVQMSALSWSLRLCSCGRAADCACATREDPHGALQDEVTAYFLAYRLGVYRYLRHRGCAPVDAEDLTQDTFLRLYRARIEGRHFEQQHVLPWAIMVARRLAIDRHRRRRIEYPLFGEFSGDLADTIPDDGLDSEQALTERQRRAACARGLQELTDLQRQCLRLRASGLSLRATSATVGISERRVSEAVWRAVRRLKKFIDALA
jgi:RNA polymerase sigma-70 factor, ECF subfamily